MKSHAVRPLLAVAVMVVCAAGFAARAQSAPARTPKHALFTIVNNTEWTIQGIQISEAEEDVWSANLIKSKPLTKGASVKLKVECMESDVRLVDTKGKTCTSESMYPCGRHATWTLKPEELAGCKDFGR